MDPSLPPPDDEATIRARLDDADDALFGFLHFIRLRISEARPGLLTRRFIGLILRTLLVPAEALLRRSLYALAALVAPVPPRPAPARRTAPPQAAPNTAPRQRAPVFRLTEPAPRAAAPSARTPAKPSAARRALSDPEKIEAGFLRRVDAFERALQNPLRVVRRLQRRLSAARSKAIQPLRPGIPPGIVNTGNAYLQFVFEQMSGLADRTISRACDTS